MQLSRTEQQASLAPEELDARLKAAVDRLAAARRRSDNATEAWRQALRGGHFRLTSAITEAKTEADVALSLAVWDVLRARADQLEAEADALPYTLAGVAQ